MDTPPADPYTADEVGLSVLDSTFSDYNPISDISDDESVPSFLPIESLYAFGGSGFFMSGVEEVCNINYVGDHEEQVYFIVDRGVESDGD